MLQREVCMLLEHHQAEILLLGRYESGVYMSDQAICYILASLLSYEFIINVIAPQRLQESSLSRESIVRRRCTYNTKPMNY